MKIQEGEGNQMRQDTTIISFDLENERKVKNSEWVDDMSWDDNALKGKQWEDWEEIVLQLMEKENKKRDDMRLKGKKRTQIKVNT